MVVVALLLPEVMTEVVAVGAPVVAEVEVVAAVEVLMKTKKKKKCCKMQDVVLPRTPGIKKGAISMLPFQMRRSWP